MYGLGKEDRSLLPVPHRYRRFLRQHPIFRALLPGMLSMLGESRVSVSRPPGYSGMLHDLCADSNPCVQVTRRQPEDDHVHFPTVRYAQWLAKNLEIAARRMIRRS